MLGKSPIKWRQRPDMTIAVEWDVKHQFKQANKQTKEKEMCNIYIELIGFSMSLTLYSQQYRAYYGQYAVSLSGQLDALFLKLNTFMMNRFAYHYHLVVLA